MALNKVMLIGNVGNDPEVRYLDQNAQNPSRVATIRLATSERRRDQNNELKEYTEWHTVVAWGRNAELVEKYVRKGAQLYVEGSLRTRSWDGRDGQKHYVTEIRAEVIQMLSRRDASSAAAGGQPSSSVGTTPSAYGAVQPSAPSAVDMPVDDDLPF